MEPRLKKTHSLGNWVKRAVCRHASLPGTPFAVGAQRGGKTHLPSATARPHLWCVGDTALHRPRVPERVQYKIAVLTFTSARRDICGLLSPSLTYPVGELCGQQVPAALSRRPSNCLYCWQPCLSSCRSSSLERSVRGRRLIVIIADFPPSTENSSFSTFIPSPDFLTVWLASVQWSL